MCVHLCMLMIIKKEILVLGKGHCVKSVQTCSYFWSVFSCIRISVFSPNSGKYRPKIGTYLEPQSGSSTSTKQYYSDSREDMLLILVSLIKFAWKCGLN